MAFKAFIVVCAQTFLIQYAWSQCLNPAFKAGVAPPYGLSGTGLGYDGYAYGAGCASASSNGGTFSVTSGSPLPPTGVSVVSENTIEGALGAEGNLPLLGSVGVDGSFPTAGASAVSYGCGNGAVGIASEGPISGIVGRGLAAGPAFAPSYGSGIGRINGLGYSGMGAGIGRPCGAAY